MSRVHQKNFSSQKNEPNLSSFENLYPLYHTRCNLPKTKKKRRVRSTRQYSTTSQSETSTEVRMG